MPSADFLDIRYAQLGDHHIGYAELGTGERTIVYVPTWFNNLDAIWERSVVRRFYTRLADLGRVVLFDKRGFGISDPIEPANMPTIEWWLDDITTVLDAVGASEVCLFGSADGSELAALYAATYPERVDALVLFNARARTLAAPDYPWGMPREELEGALTAFAHEWGRLAPDDGLFPSAGPGGWFRQWMARYQRLCASPGVAAALNRMLWQVDIRNVLPVIRVPTLVMHRRDAVVPPVEHGRYLAENIPGAKYVELDGGDYSPESGDSEAVLGEIEEFLTGSRHAPELDRVLATVLFSDICDSTQRAAELGDRAWRRLLDEHDALATRVVERHRGRIVKSTGDGVLATFDGPARALAAAVGLRDGVRRLGIDIRAGLHTGEVETRGSDIGGLAVHIASRVSAEAAAGDVVVSSTVKDLVTGSGLMFTDVGRRELKGVPDEWHLYRLESLEGR
ncbi:MAG: alpha/beta fold hydrolase [Mycobacteriales bacterium]